MVKAKDIMNSSVVTIDPDDTIEEAMSRMIRLGISGLPVVDMAGQLIGIITEFDLLDIIWDPHTDKDKVYNYMTRDIHTITEDDDITDIADMFKTLPVRRLIVVSGKNVVGVVSRRDMIWHVLKVRGKLPEPQKA
jgi:CBS domain-containing protein